uniref:DDB1- and CUL4-associated factor 15 WD40 repeat-containing domain-containing protein n=1 Tax=Photinus pyralis TaxID=7054 RepID=A0A1Y1K8R7_PHOPY
MASSVSEDSSDSEIFKENPCHITNKFFTNNDEENFKLEDTNPRLNLVQKITNRQIYGRFTRHSRASTERIFNDIYYKCRYSLENFIPKGDPMSHIFMGFTLCGRFFISYTTKLGESNSSAVLFPSVEYVLYIWRFVPGQTLRYVGKHRIFRLFKSSLGLDEVMFMQFPLDPYKIICYAIATGNPSMAFLTVLTLPTRNCRNCQEFISHADEKLTQGWCLKHGFMLNFMFTMSQPMPSFNPHISLAFPDHLVINTGHCIHILNISTLEPSRPLIQFPTQYKEYDNKFPSNIVTSNNIDCLSEVSESPSEFLNTSSVVDAILEDFNEYDLEGNDHNKPFHELNISCEPLNVTGKNYHNALVQNIVDTRLKHLQNANKDCLFSVPQTSGLQKPLEKMKVDKKNAEKAYEFTEENEKCEKLSLFRKKRLADKKYEFSEDNSENIVPFYSLRRERRCIYRSQNYCIKSPEFSNALFLSPRSSSIRSPMQSPNSRHGQFSPGGGRNIYSPIIRNCPIYSKSPISPKDTARKFNIYSPGTDSDCSDSDSRLILRPVHNISTSHYNDVKSHLSSGLLIVDSKQTENVKWIKKIVKRYSSADFENSSLLSGQSRDDYNVSIEIPVLVQTLAEQYLDIVPEVKADQLAETQLIITQRTFDCDQFVQSRAQQLCVDAKLEFLHCEDYDIKILHICPLNGHIVCKAVITIVALQDLVPYCRRNIYIADCIFTWNIADNTFEVIEPPMKFKLQTQWFSTDVPLVKIPSIVHKKVLVMDQLFEESKRSLRDYNNCFEICMDSMRFYSGSPISNEEYFDEYSIPSESD